MFSPHPPMTPKMSFYPKEMINAEEPFSQTTQIFQNTTRRIPSPSKNEILVKKIGKLRMRHRIGKPSKFLKIIGISSNEVLIKLVSVLGNFGSIRFLDQRFIYQG